MSTIRKIDGDHLVKQIRGCIERSQDFAAKTPLADYSAHLLGGLSGVLEEIEPRLQPIFKEAFR